MKRIELIARFFSCFDMVRTCAFVNKSRKVRRSESRARKQRSYFLERMNKEGFSRYPARDSNERVCVKL